MQKKLKRTIVFAMVAATLASCGGSDSDGSPSGTWIGSGNDHKPRRIVLYRDGRFQASYFPVAAACSDSSLTGGIDGDGEWENDAEGGRVLLTFQKLSDRRCNVPYGSVIFRTSNDGLTVFLDVDRPSTAVLYARKP